MHTPVLYLIILFIATGHCIDPKLIKYYEDLINNETEKAKNYKLDVDARRYQCYNNLKTELFGTYDFIVIGAGSSGSVVANRLSEIGDWKVLLLEAGGYQNNFTDIPVMTTISTFSDYNWGFGSVPQKNVCQGMVNNVCPYPRGRALGGSTVINGLAYSRGIAKGFDALALLGNPGWAYNDVIPHFLKSENIELRDPKAVLNYDYHSVGGPLNVEYHIPGSRELDDFLKANVELGYNVTDINSPIDAGVSRAPVNTLRGKRFSGYNAYIEPVETRRNLKISPHSYVTKIIIDDTKKVVGVQFTNKGITYIANVTKEVIVSAGTIGSPHILMLSGIGPKEHLQSKGIKVIQDLPVGKGLKDHVGIGIFFSTSYPIETKSLKEYINEYLVGIGGLAAPGPNNAFGFYQTPVEKTPNYPDLEIILVPNYGNVTADFSKRSLNLKDDTLNAYIPKAGKRIIRIDVFGLHTRSTGNISLNTSNPFDYPLIDPQCLTDKENIDLDTMYEGIKMVLKLMETEAMKRINTQLQLPSLPACNKYTPLSKDFWICVIKQIGHPVNHPIGSCQMGRRNKTSSVVDGNLRVHGIQNLRVADASIFPIALTGHPNGPCVMVGEKASDIIKRYHGKL